MEIIFSSSANWLPRGVSPRLYCKPFCSAAGNVIAGLAESNGSLPPSGWLLVTCGLKMLPLTAQDCHNAVKPLFGCRKSCKLHMQNHFGAYYFGKFRPHNTSTAYVIVSLFVRFNFSTMLNDWMGRTSLQWPVCLLNVTWNLLPRTSWRAVYRAPICLFRWCINRLRSLHTYLLP